MEPLWSPVVATAGNWWQIESAPKRQKQAKTVAVSCDQFGKERMVTVVSIDLSLAKEGVTFLAPQRRSRPANPRARTDKR